MKKKNPMKAVNINDGTLSLPAIDFFLLTAVDVERDAMMKHMKAIPAQGAILKISWHESTYFLGLVGQYVCILSKCSMGAKGRAGSTLATAQAIDRFKPSGVIMVGIAFGKNKKAQMIGDVLYADKLIFYEIQRGGKNRTFMRGSQPEPGEILLNRAENFGGTIKVKSEVTGKTVERKPQKGAILSGDKLVDNKTFKAELLATFPEAIGGEMEGEGLYAASSSRHTEWLLVKGICDWADGNKSLRKAERQALAAKTATQFIADLLGEPGLEREHFVRADVATGTMSHAIRAMDVQAKTMALENSVISIRHAYRLRQEKSEALAQFMGQFEVQSNGRRTIPAAQKTNAEMLNHAFKNAIEAWLNAYNDVCVSLLAGSVDKEAFIEKLGVEILALINRDVAPQKVTERLYPRETSDYQAIWTVVDNLRSHAP